LRLKEKIGKLPFQIMVKMIFYGMVTLRSRWMMKASGAVGLQGSDIAVSSRRREWKRERRGGV
jgi:hypothetical protein